MLAAAPKHDVLQMHVSSEKCVPVQPQSTPNTMCTHLQDPVCFGSMMVIWGQAEGTPLTLRYTPAPSLTTTVLCPGRRHHFPALRTLPSTALARTAWMHCTPRDDTIIHTCIQVMGGPVDTQHSDAGTKHSGHDPSKSSHSRPSMIEGLTGGHTGSTTNCCCCAAAADKCKERLNKPQHPSTQRVGDSPWQGKASDQPPQQPPRQVMHTNAASALNLHTSFDT
jgi:hypothetical protein